MVYGDQHWHLIVSTGTYDSVPHGGTVFLSQQWAQQLLFIHSIYIKDKYNMLPKPFFELWGPEIVRIVTLVGVWLISYTVTVTERSG